MYHNICPQHFVPSLFFRELTLQSNSFTDYDASTVQLILIVLTPNKKLIYSNAKFIIRKQQPKQQ